MILQPYLNLIRFQNQTGTILLFIPCLYGVIHSETTSIYDCLLFFISAFLARSCGCILNDIADRNIDASLPTTQNRVIASGKISVTQALTFFIVLMLLGLPLLFFYSSYIFPPLFFIGILVVLYPYTKRFFAMPQLILGIVYASGFLLATVHTKNISILQINAQDIQIYISLILWVIFYDTIYAKRDFHYDKSLKINSSAVLFAKHYNKILPFVLFAFGICAIFINLYAWLAILLAISLSFFINAKLTHSVDEAKINNILFFLCGISNAILLYNQSTIGTILILFAMLLQIISVFLKPQTGFKLNTLSAFFILWCL